LDQQIVLNLASKITAKFGELKKKETLRLILYKILF